MPTFTLLNTRPKHQAQGLSALVEKRGGKSIICPTMAIQNQDLPVQRSHLNSFDHIVLVSVNAVNAFFEHGFSSSQSNQACSNWYAIGKATFDAAKKAGLPVKPNLGHAYTSERLLEDPSLQALKDKKVLIIRGNQGRDLMAQTFKERGAQVEQWPLYHRVPMPLCTSAWQTFKKARNPIVLGTSVTALEFLIEALKSAPQWTEEKRLSELAILLAKPLVVFSERIKMSAQQLGWLGTIAVVATQSDRAIIDCIIESHWDK